jgi:DNA-binding response OmpR family regulator
MTEAMRDILFPLIVVAFFETNYLRVYLAQIRRKLEPDPAQPRYFLTEPRMGYRFEPGVSRQ